MGLATLFSRIAQQALAAVGDLAVSITVTRRRYENGQEVGVSAVTVPAIRLEAADAALDEEPVRRRTHRYLLATADLAGALPQPEDLVTTAEGSWTIDQVELDPAGATVLVHVRA